MNGATPDLEMSLPARPENVAVIRHVLGGVGDALGMDPDTLADVRLAVSEACANVIVHAYREGETGLLDLELTAQDARVHIVIRDHGRGMAPREDSPGLGVGLPLIASLTDNLKLLGAPSGGTEVHMSFPVPALADGDAGAGAAGTGP